MSKYVLVFVLSWAWVYAQVGAQFNIKKIFNDEISNDERFENVSVQPSFLDGYITLNGYVDNLWQKERLIQIAKAVNGAQGVIDKTTLASVSIDSKELAQNLAQALYRDEVAEVEQLTVSTDDYGRVRLRGDVNSQQEKLAAEQAIKQVKGINYVESLVKVVPTTNRSEAEKEADVEFALSNIVLIDERLLESDVDGDVAIVRGHVGSETEAEVVENVAKSVSGIKDTRITDLTVVPSMDRTLIFKITPSSIKYSDEELASIVDKANYYDTRVFSYDIDVSASDGVVKLDGSVENESAREAAIQNANNVLGVRGVVDNLSVGELSPGAEVLAE
ncbi:MAG: BON domain-containing protein [Bacteriovoracaceae bacterium]|nr:BON domain-containing protein [Bacteriovoracaceae bacterium]